MQALKLDTQHFGFLPQVVASRSKGPHISLYVPFHPGNPEESRINFRNLIREARDLFSFSGSPMQENDMIKPMERMFQSYLRKKDAKGIAMFRSPTGFFHTPLKIEPPELVVVANSFHLKPLMHCISTRPAYYAITVSNQLVQLFRVQESEAKLMQQYHHISRDESDNEFVSKKKIKEDQMRFFRQAAKQLTTEFDLLDRSVAILGSRIARKKLKQEIQVRANCDFFYEGNSPYTMEKMVAELEPMLRSHRKEQSQKFARSALKNQGNGLISNSIQDIAIAASHGRVETLIVDPDIQMWGEYNRRNGMVIHHSRQISDKDDCIVDDIAEDVVRKGGEVVFFDSRELGNVPSPIAVLRW